jgi:hypothetical protein
MKSARRLLSALAGVAVLATPMTAAAFDHHHGAGFGWRSAAVSPAPRAFGFRSAPRSFVAAPAFAPRFRPRVAPMAFTAAPIIPSSWSPATTPMYANYGYPAAAPLAAPMMAYSGWGHPNACANAQRAMNIARTDRLRGHPAAAADVMRQGAGAMVNCNRTGGMPATGFYGYNGAYASPLGGMLGGVTPVPMNTYRYHTHYNAYPYGNGASSMNTYKYNRSYNAYPYRNGASSMTTPLLSRFIR